MLFGQPSTEVQEPEDEPAPALQPGLKLDTRMDAITSCLRLVLVSCGQIRDIKMENGLSGASSVLMSAELHCGPRGSSRSYEVMKLTRQALDGITSRLPTVTLLSARVQKEDCGYSLRSAIAFVPDHAQSHMCWDMFRNGHCPRRGLCRWYHPIDSDTARVKVSIRYTAEDVNDVLREEQLRPSHSAGKCTISLGELVQ